jgi:hypothetical protein
MTRGATTVVAAVLAATGLAGCPGGGDDTPQRTDRRAQPPAPPRITAFDLPHPDEGIDPRRLRWSTAGRHRGAPLRADAEIVIRRWLAALREADFERAASYFRVPVRVQSGPRIEDLGTRRQVESWNRSLPCGAVLERLRPGRDGFVVATLQLTDRAGSTCGSGTSGRARTAIRVQGGRISEWYSLPASGR